MTRDYTTRSFLRHVPAPLLQEYFAQRPNPLGLDWPSLRDDDVEPIFVAMEALGPQEFGAIEAEFREVHALASAQGIRTLIEEADSAQVDLRGTLAAMDGLEQKALWVFLHHRTVFDLAGLLDVADQWSRRYRVKRNGLPHDPPDVSEAALRELVAALSACYWHREGRGKPCHVDHQVRRGRPGRGDLHYFFVYLADHGGVYPTFGPDDRLHRRSERRSFEVVFAFDPQEGSLELCAHGTKALRQEVQDLFGQAILHTKLAPEKPTAQPYVIAGLAQRGFAFRLPPEAGGMTVQVKSLRFAVKGNAVRKITVTGDPRLDGDVYDLMDRALDKQGLPLSQVEVDHADLQVRFPSFLGKPKQFTFGVSPTSCSLKDEPAHLLARECLRLSGIAVA